MYSLVYQRTSITLHSRVFYILIYILKNVLTRSNKKLCTFGFVDKKQSMLQLF